MAPDDVRPRLYTAIQALREERAVSPAALADLADRVATALGSDQDDPARAPFDRLASLLARGIAPATVELAEVKGPALVAALTTPAATAALRVGLAQCGLTAKAVAALGALPVVRELVLRRSRLTADALAALLARPVIHQVERLSLGGNTFGDAGADQLAALALPALRALEIGYVKMTLAGLTRLLTAPVARELRSFQVSTDRHGPPLGAVLAGAAPLANLQGLRMYKTGLGNAGLAALVAAPPFRLRRLALYECGIGEKGIAALAASEAMVDLEELRLRYDPMTDKALTGLCQSPHVRGLRRLQISQCRITDRGLAALAASGLPLEELDLSTNPLGPGALLALGKLRTLRHLDLGGYHGGDADVVAFAAQDDFPHLESLALGNNDLTDHAVAALVTWPHFHRLRHLDLHTNNITDEAIDLIARTPNRLASIGVYQTRVRTALPAVRMETTADYAPSPWA